jgi:hypothetical protein
MPFYLWYLIVDRVRPTMNRWLLRAPHEKKGDAPAKPLSGGNALIFELYDRQKSRDTLFRWGVPSLL